MHIPKSFQQNDTSQLLDLISNYPFAIMVCTSLSDFDAHHIPLYIVEMPDGSYTLKGHIAKANPLWETVKNGASALVIFQGPQHYISPNFYPSKKEHGKAVPTWNYVSVHIKGKISFVHNTEWKLSQNQPAENRAGVINGLSEPVRLNTNAMPELMENLSKPTT